MKKLYKLENEKKVCGVCAGIADFFGWDESIVRIATVLFCLIFEPAIIAYVVAAMILPDKAEVIEDKNYREI